MKNLLRMILPAVLLMTFLGGSALAQNKIATVDLRKLFDGYWKTRQAQADIQAQKAQLQKDDKAYLDDYKKAADEYQQLLTQANDQAISAEERDRRKQSVADALKKLQERQTTIKQYEQQAQATLSEKLQQMREKVLADIQGVVNAKARTGGYFLVLDTAAQTVNNTAMVVYHDSENDLTDDVLKQLNAGAPIDTTAPSATISSPSLMDTNSP
jgi:outer membrane protein